LDQRRVVVFPLRILGASSPAEQGDAVATYIGYALAAADPLKWIDGVRLLAASSHAQPTDFSRLTEQVGAAYYVDGDVLSRGDSAVVRLALHSVANDSVVARGAANGASIQGVPTLGVRALAQLLPTLIDPGHRVDVSLLTNRDAEAITSFLTGEREYRGMHFERAVEHYTRAVAMDSAFAIAAVKGAMAQSWLDRNYALDLVEAALRHEQSLPRQYRSLAHGIRFGRLGFGDSAVARTREATLLDPPSSEAWQAYGDALYHQLPSISGADSLAEAAYRRARDVDPQFTPALFHLAELAMRRGDLRYWDSVRVARAQGRIDSVEFSQLSHMRDCLAGGSSRDAEVDVFGALAAGKVLAAGGAQPRCAKLLLGRALTAPSADLQNRWGALLALQSLLVATADTTALDSLLHSAAVKDLPAWVPIVLDALGARVLKAAADSVARDQGSAWPTMRASHVWLLGLWQANKGGIDEARRALAALQVKRDSTRAPTDSLFVNVLSAHLTLATRDTARAIMLLRALTPSGSPTDIAWQPWQALAGERMLLAELLYERGANSEAMKEASLIDALEPVVHLIYLRRSLELRARAAERLARPALARAYRARLASLASE
jgi:Tfp pilus assembly protein PilF